MKLQQHQTILTFLLLGSFFCISACSTRIQITEYPTEQEKHLATLQSYCWADSIKREGALEKMQPTGGHHNVFDAGIRTAINTSLLQKGYKQVDCNRADFIIDYRMGLHEDVAAVDESTGTRADTAANPYGPRWSIGDDSSVNYDGLVKPKDDIITVRHGTIHIAAFTSGNAVLWHSSAEKTLREQDSDETRRENINSAVQKLMTGFPAKQ